MLQHRYQLITMLFRIVSSAPSIQANRKSRKNFAKGALSEMERNWRTKDKLLVASLPRMFQWRGNSSTRPLPICRLLYYVECSGGSQGTRCLWGTSSALPCCSRLSFFVRGIVKFPQCHYFLLLLNLWSIPCLVLLPVLEWYINLDIGSRCKDRTGPAISGNMKAVYQIQIQENKAARGFTSMFAYQQLSSLRDIRTHVLFTCNLSNRNIFVLVLALIRNKLICSIFFLWSVWK